jgi:hypothetical protein
MTTGGSAQLLLQSFLQSLIGNEGGGGLGAGGPPSAGTMQLIWNHIQSLEAGGATGGDWDEDEDEEEEEDEDDVDYEFEELDEEEEEAEEESDEGEGVDEGEQPFGQPESDDDDDDDDDDHGGFMDATGDPNLALARLLAARYTNAGSTGTLEAEVRGNSSDSDESDD